MWRYVETSTEVYCAAYGFWILDQTGFAVPATLEQCLSRMALCGWCNLQHSFLHQVCCGQA